MLSSLTAKFLNANITSPTSPPCGHLSRHVKHERQCQGNCRFKTSERRPRIIISINLRGLCSSTTLATGQLLVHLPHCMHARTPRPLGVFATSCMKWASEWFNQNHHFTMFSSVTHTNKTIVLAPSMRRFMKSRSSTSFHI
jgi:hypothetical protein